MDGTCSIGDLICFPEQQLAHKSSTTSLLQQIGQEPDVWIDFHGVRITPHRVVFKGAYEGKHFKAKIVLQNIGKHVVLVRMASPTSCYYTIKTFPRGQHLSPGLCIDRYLEFTYSQVCVKFSSLPIYVNEERYDIDLEITTSSAELMVNPRFVDFGCVDAGLTSPPKFIDLTNVGSKGTKFSFDLVGGKHELLIEPTKGYIKARQKITVTVRLLTYKEGIINTELWIRSETPRMIAIQGVIIIAKFEAIHPNATSKFTVIDFPSIYHKSTYTKRLLIRNYSSTNSMFCVLGELKDGRLMPLSRCKRIDKTFKFFEIYPSEGRFEPKETKLFHLTFQPKHFIDNLGRLKPYYFAAFQICKVNCKDIDPNEKIFEDPILLSITPHHNPSAASFFGDAPNVTTTVDPSLLHSESSAHDVNLTIRTERPLVRVYLHGLAENANITVVPDELILLENKVNAKLTRVLEIKNNSVNLPIILHYKKVAYIDLERNIFLKPGEKKQISVFLTHHSIGLLNTQIYFDLIHYNSPKNDNNDFVIVGNVIVPVTLESIAVTKYPHPVINTGLNPNYIKEEGMFCDGLKYCDLMEKPKSIFVDTKQGNDKYCSDVIAFPNDRPHSLRPRIYDSEKCKTIFGRKPRYVPPLDETYEMTIFERAFKREINAYYSNIARRQAEKLRCLQRTSLKAIEDEYSYAENYKVNFNNVPMLCGNRLNQRIVKGDCFLPLSPIELNMISVSPLVIETGKIACYYGYKLHLKITNRNSLSLRLYFKPDDPAVLFPDSLRRIIHPNSETEIEMDYMAGPPGYYVITVDIFINESVITQVIILADVVHHSLQLSTYNIQLDDGKYTEYISIINNLNVTVHYYWDLPFCNFTVEPFSGSVRAHSSLTCVLIYYSHIGGPNVADIEFHSGDKDVQFVKVYCVIPDEKIELITQSITFENIPLNMRVTRMIMFRNPLKQSISYSVEETELGEDLEVEPENGIITGKLLLEISVSVTFQHCFNFSTVIVVDVTKVGKFEIPVSGNVVYPAIKFIPSTLQFKGVPFSSTDSLKFDIKNCSDALIKIQIDMSDYHEFIVSEQKFHWGTPPVEEFIILPTEIKNFYLHYMPMECSKSVFYLPVTINGILGPALIIDPITLKVDYHLTTHYKSVQEIPLPVNLDVLKITGLAKPGKISFSKLAIDFTLGIRTERRYKTQYDLKITNCQKEHDDICIRTDEIQFKGIPFVIGSNDENVDVFESAIVCHIKPLHTVVLSVEFCPTTYGYYKTFLPFYLRSDLSTEFHNIIEVRGNYMSPTITGERLTFVLQAHTTAKEITFKPVKESTRKMVFYSRPIPLKIIACSTKKYLFRDHYKNCKVNTTTNLTGLSMQIQWDTLNRLNECDYEVEVTIKYSAEENTQFTNTLEISCSCGGVWNATVIGCAENCFLTSYAFAETFLPDQLEAFGFVSESKKGFSMATDLDSLFQARPSLMSAVSRRDIGKIGTGEFHTMEFFSSYPFFPTEPSSLTAYLECCVDHMEEWVCNQCFYKTIRYQIPETISSMVSLSKSENITIRTKKARRVDFLVPPYAKLLINMVGHEMVNYLQLGKTPKTDEETAWYLYTIYDNAIRFVKSLGAYFICLKPEHLLTYDMFLAFKTYIVPTLGQNVANTSKSIKNYQEFYQLAKQSWLDLLLQTYKVLYLYRLNSILMVTTTDPLICPVIEPLENFKKSVKNFRRNANIFSHAELLLINWLEYHYMNSKKHIWSEELPNKDVNFFGENLQDGFVFAAVTGVYCPYMIPYLRTMIVDADMFEELLHNTCIVTRCWKMLNCSFAVKPEDILDPNSVHILMLIAYLFEVLPSMYPYETIEFTIGLSNKIINTIVLKNINDFHICYKAIFFSNEDKCFKTDKEMYVIPPGQTCKIIITYYAKFAKNITCTLLLSGENDNYHFSRNRTFTLIGIPDITYMTSTIKYPIYHFEVSDVSFTVKSPYLKATSYNIQISYDEIATLTDLNNIPFVQKEQFQTPSKFMPVEAIAQFDERGIFEFQSFCTVLVYEDQTIYIYFRNPNVGDFAISFEIIMKEARIKEVIDVILPKNFTDFGQSRTGRGVDRVFIEIPSRNRLFWNTIMELMLRICEGDVLEFFKRNIGTTIGMQILQEIILGSGIDKSDTCDSITYEIIPDTDCEIILPDTVYIEDECSHTTISLPVKFISSSDIPPDFTFCLISHDGRFRRYYATNFICEH